MAEASKARQYPLEPFNIIFQKKYQPIPIFLIRIFLGNGGKKITPFRLYLYLNIRSNGCVYLDRGRKRQIMADLNIKESTLNKNLRRLEDHFGWVRRWKSNKTRYYVDGFDRIAKRICTRERSGVVIDLQKYLHDERLFKARMVGAYIVGIVERQNKRNRRRNRKRIPKLESLNGGNSNGSAPAKGSLSTCWWPVAANYLAKSLNVEKETAITYRRLAQEYEFIEVMVKRLPISRSEELDRQLEGGRVAAMIRYRKDGVPTIDLPHFIRANQTDPEKAYQFRCLSRRSLPKLPQSSDFSSTDNILLKEESSDTLPPFF